VFKLPPVDQAPTVVVKVHSSVFAKIGGSCVPPIFIAEVFVPDPKLDFVEVFKLFTSVQFVPFHCSVIV